MLKGFAPSIFLSFTLSWEIWLFFFFWWLINHCVIPHKLPFQLMSTEDLTNARKRVSLSSVPLKPLKSDFISFPFIDSIAPPVFHSEGQSLVCWTEEKLPVHVICGLICVFLCTSSWEIWELAYTSFIWSPWNTSFIWSPWNQSTWETRWTVNQA